jgi:D-alanine-D-alanine ligase
MTGERGERTSPRLSRLRPACLGHYTSGKGMMQSDQEPPGVVVLYNASDKLVKGEPRDLLAEQGVVACAQAVADALQRAGYQVAQVPIYNDVELALAPYPLTRWVVFNLGEGLEGRLFEEARIAWALEAMGYRFTGSDGYAISRAAHKVRTKALLAAAGMPTPPWRVFRDPAEVPDAPLPGLPFPLIVKPVAEDASLGIGPNAVVYNPEALRHRVAYVVERYQQAALAESFILGREFNVSVWSDPPQVLPLAEIDFSAFSDPLECIVSFAAKWLEDSFEYHHTPAVCPADVEPWLGGLITETALRAYEMIGCRGYTRVDMRVADGVPYVLEVNPNPDLSPDAGFARAACAAGYDYTAMITHILLLALRQGAINDYTSYGGRSGSHLSHSDRCGDLYPDRDCLRRRVAASLSDPA